jgi:hypothetical protein
VRCVSQFPSHSKRRIITEALPNRTAITASFQTSGTNELSRQQSGRDLREGRTFGYRVRGTATRTRALALADFPTQCLFFDTKENLTDLVDFIFSYDSVASMPDLKLLSHAIRVFINVSWPREVKFIFAIGNAQSCRAGLTCSDQNCPVHRSPNSDLLGDAWNHLPTRPITLNNHGLFGNM